MKRAVAGIAGAILLAALPAAARAYVFSGQTGSGSEQPLELQSSGDAVVWPDDEVRVGVTLNFQGAFEDSAVDALLTSWNRVGTKLQFFESGTAGQPCGSNNDEVNAAGWRTRTCDGTAFGDALAITLITYNFRGGRWEIADADIEPPPSFGTRLRADFISGMAKVGEQLAIVLDIAKVVSVDELSSLAAIAAPAAEPAP